MTFAILAVAVLLSAIAWSLFVQWRTQRRKLDESERQVADAISRHIELLSAVATVLVTKGSIALAAVMMLAACTKEGDTIYEWDPNEPKASTKPLVTVIYGQVALGDRSYNDAAAGSCVPSVASDQGRVRLPPLQQRNKIPGGKKVITLTI